LTSIRHDASCWLSTWLTCAAVALDAAVDDIIADAAVDLVRARQTKDEIVAGNSLGKLSPPQVRTKLVMANSRLKRNDAGQRPLLTSRHKPGNPPTTAPRKAFFCPPPLDRPRSVTYHPPTRKAPALQTVPR